MTHPIELPDGIYHRLSSPPISALEDLIVRATEAARNFDMPVWLIFNGTSVRVEPKDTDAGVLKRYSAHRNKYQEDAGI